MALYKHRAFCGDEEAWVYSWTENMVPLASCPNDSTHALVPYSESVVDTRELGVINITKELGFRLGGLYRVESVPLSVPAADPGGPGAASVQRSWAFDIAIYSLRFVVPAEGAGALLTVDVAPDAPAGTLLLGAQAGQTTLVVSPGIFGAVGSGHFIALGDTAVGMIVRASPAAGIIEIADALAADYPPDTPIFRCVKPCIDLELVQGSTTIGSDYQNSILVPSGGSVTLSVSTGADAFRMLAYVSYSY